MRRWPPWRAHKESPYKVVPRLNLIEGPGTRHIHLIARGTLALLLVGGAFLLQDLYRTATALQEQVARVERQLDNTQQELGAAQQEVADLNNRIQELQKGSGNGQQMKLQWAPALAALRGLQEDGVTFRSLEGDASGMLTLVAAAPEGGPLARLQARLQGADLPIELRTVRWENQEGETVMTATLRLRGAQ